MAQLAFGQLLQDLSVARAATCGASSRARTVLAAEACLFFSRPPKATAPQTPLSAFGRKPATQPRQPSGPGCVAVAKVSFLGGRGLSCHVRR